MTEIRPKPKLYFLKRWFLLLATPLYLVLSIVYLALDINSSTELLSYLFVLLFFFLLVQVFGFLAAYRECFRYSYLYAFCSTVAFLGNLLLVSIYGRDYVEDEGENEQPSKVSLQWWPLLITLTVLSGLLCIGALLWAFDLYRIRHGKAVRVPSMVILVR
ncbi:hypothetical protein TYRP_022250 [Tyrophagus putrescentiae]|nr:hypothetical protein TYRP_022250 [Tyrophagus putrescentiae]